jgi:hypothetical protein
MHVTVVIPTYRRGQKLARTIGAILESDFTDLEQVELIVVDDGSPESIEPVVRSFASKPPVRLTYIRQENAGPAAARNTGFRHASGDVVLFIDDDIVCPPTLIRDHVEAHRRRPGSVIYGRYPLIARTPSPLLKLMDSLSYDPGEHAAEEFLKMPVIASGHLSVERAMFNSEEGVYRDDLYTPVAEEFELAWRLQKQGIPILLAPRIVAAHDRPVELQSMCRQAFTHAKGCGEVLVKYPDTANMPELRQVSSANRPVCHGDPVSLRIKKSIKRSLSAAPVCAGLLRTVQWCERWLPGRLMPLASYRLIVGLHFFSGFQTGMAMYSQGPRSRPCEAARPAC